MLKEEWLCACNHGLDGRLQSPFTDQVTACHRPGHNPKMKWPWSAALFRALDESTWCVVAITPCWCSLLFMTCQNPWHCFTSLKLMKLGILSILAAYQVSTWTRWRKSCRCRFLGAVFMQNLFHLNSTYLECWDESQEIQCLHNAGLRCFVVHQCIKVAIHLFEDVLGKHVNSISITRQSLGPLGILHPLASWNASCFNPVQLLNTSDASQAKRCQDTFNFVGFSPLLPWKKWSMCSTRACSAVHTTFWFPSDLPQVELPSVLG